VNWRYKLDPLKHTFTKLLLIVSLISRPLFSPPERTTFLQIKGLQENLKDRDNQISQLQSMINSYSDFSENNRLKEEMHVIKQKNCERKLIIFN